MQRLFLDNKEVDLLPKLIAQTYQVNDLAELKDRQLHHTQRFFLPDTPRNVIVMQYLGVTGSKSRKPYEKIPARYVYNGVEMMPTGWAKASSSKKGGYDVTIYDGNASLYEVLTGRRMNDLNYDDLNHALNNTTHEASLDNTSGYIYALMDSGFATITGVVNSERQVAALYKHTLFNKILSEAGFTYSGALFSDPNFLSEVVCPTKGYDVVGEEQTETAKGNTTSNTVSKNQVTLKDPEIENHQFDLTDVGLVDISVQGGNILQFDVDGLYHVSISLNYTLTTGTAFMYVKLNGTQVGGTIILTESVPTTATQEFYIQAVAGDQIEYWIESQAIEGALPNKFEIVFTSDVDVDYKSVTGGLIIKFEDIMPDSSQIDFIKSVMQDYGLMFQAEKNTNHYNFITIEELVNDRANAEDWSDKLLSKGEEVYNIGKYAQNNYMLYKYESDEVQDISYDGNLKATHENIKDEAALFTSIYTISRRTQFRNSIPVYQIPIWKEKVEQEATIIQNLETQFRSFKIEYFDEAITFEFGSVVGTYTRASNMPFLSLTNMAYDFNIANYYPGFKRILDAQKKRTVVMLLKPADIYNLNFLRLKYIKQLGQYYYLNKVSNFVDGKQTKVILIQTNELTVNQPPSQLGAQTYTLSNGGTKVLTLSDFINTLPGYTDPEFDQPETIKFTAGFDPEIVIKNNGVAITDDTPFNANDFNLTIEDQGGNALAHSTVLSWTIQSFNNSNFSTQTGTFTVNVNEHANLTPVADAGFNLTMLYDSGSNPDAVVNPDGSSSSDPNGDVLTYLWTADSLPTGVILSDSTSVACQLNGTGLTIGVNNTIITMTLRVTDPGGLWSEDTMIVQLIDLAAE